MLKDTLSAGLFAGGLPELEEAIRKAMQSRIDLLLDVYRTAADLSDKKWMEEIGLRLSQLTAQSAESAK